MIPIDLVLLLNVIEHGDDVHREQQPLPSIVLHLTSINGHSSIISSSSGDNIISISDNISSCSDNISCSNNVD